MIIETLSDLHGYLPDLPGGDLLIIGGDLTARDEEWEYVKFRNWLSSQKYVKKIFIAGNHDNYIKNKTLVDPEIEEDIIYLCDSGTEFQGLKIWGSPWSLWFHGINPHCKAFTGTEKQIEKKFELIPSDTDILITHSPAFGILDAIPNYDTGMFQHVGSNSLRNIVLSKERMPNLKLHCFGHIHEMGGKMVDLVGTKFANCSHVDENYRPVNEPIRVEL